MSDVLMLDEMRRLREEQTHLKDCQLRYFTLTVISVGAVLGFSGSIAHVTTLFPGDENMVYAAPLAVILPCWWIFFDKAKTISRIVGYTRVLEDMICNLQSSPVTYAYQGWENSLKLFRDPGTKHNLEEVRRRFQKKSTTMGQLNTLIFNVSHKYWVLNYYTFLFSALLCLLLSFPAALGTLSLLLWGFAALLVALSAALNLRYVQRLVAGKNSYNCNEEIWRVLLHK